MASFTLKEAVSRLRDGRLNAVELCQRCLDRCGSLLCLNIFISQLDDLAQKQALSSAYTLDKDGCRKPGALEGIPVAFKDNFCTKNVATTCGSRMLWNFRPSYDATMVTRMMANGTVTIGKTNMDEFAMGSGSIYGAAGPVKNPWTMLFQNYPRLTAFRSPQYSSSRNHSDAVSVDSSCCQSVLSDIASPKSAGTQDYSDWLIAGGSSGGSAAAVAGGCVLAAFGSDTGGSTRNPASYCGVVGFKPTYGLLSRHGLIPLVNSMEVPGILTKTVEDTVLVYNAVAGHDLLDSTTVAERFQPVTLQDDFSLHGVHIGIPMEYHTPGLSPDVLDLWGKAADLLEKGGAMVTQVSLPHTQHSVNCYYVLCCCEVASNMARFDGIEFASNGKQIKSAATKTLGEGCSGRLHRINTPVTYLPLHAGHRASCEESTEELFAVTRQEGFNDVVRSRILAGNYFLLKRNYERYFLKAHKVRRLISEDFRCVFSSGVDALLTPTVPGDAPVHSWFISEASQERCEQQDVFTQPANMAGVPAITVPAGLSSNGLPIGLQFIGQNFKDETLLNIAHWFERETQFVPLNLDFLPCM